MKVHTVMVNNFTNTNNYFSTLTKTVPIPLMASCNRCNIMWKSLSVACGRSVVFSRYSDLLHQYN